MVRESNCDSFGLNEHFASLVTTLLWGDVSCGNRKKDVQVEPTSISMYVLESFWGLLMKISLNLCIRRL